MTLSAPVHKDIGEYQEKIVGKMSLRTLVCVCGGFAASVAAAATCHLALGIEVADASLPVMACSLPFWLAGFWRPYSMRLEEFLPLWLSHTFDPQRLLYVSCASSEGCAHAVAAPRTSRSGSRALRGKGVELREPSKEQEAA